MVNDFINKCKDNLGIAFIYKNKRIAYKQLYIDIFKMISLFKFHNLKPKDKVLLFVLPSYNFYLAMLSGIYYGLNIVVIDSFKDKYKVDNCISLANVKLCFVDNKSRLFKGILPKLSFINISNYYKYDSLFIDYNNNYDIVLTTFTSGTTGAAKLINRSVLDLGKQVKLLINNIDFSYSKVILCGLPIYMLLLLILGKTTIIDRKIRKKHKCDTILMPIEKVLKNRCVINSAKYMFLGGAILYKKEVLKIKHLYPNACVNYIYGSSEGVLIAKTLLSDYQDLTFNSKVNGIEVSLLDGEIMISGDSILSDDKYHLTGDLGCISEGGLKILGRKKYSYNDYYNYVLDEEILNENPYVKKGFSFWYNNNIYFVYEGKVTIKKENVCYCKSKKLPMDSKHKTKLDYNSVINYLDK